VYGWSGYGHGTAFDGPRGFMRGSDSEAAIGGLIPIDGARPTGRGYGVSTQKISLLYMLFSLFDAVSEGVLSRPVTMNLFMVLKR
jgi:hypothetical protein